MENNETLETKEKETEKLLDKYPEVSALTNNSPLMATSLNEDSTVKKSWGR